MLFVRELTPDDAPAIARIESARHQAVLADGAEAHRGFLSEAAAEGVNLSFGAFDDGTLVGYFLCYGFAPSAMPGRTEDVLYIEDVAVDPRHRGLLPLLVRRAGREMRRHFPGVAIEAHSVTSVLGIWRRHAALYPRLGYRLDISEPTGEEIAGEARHLVRWEPLPREAGGAAGFDALLARLPRQQIELEGTAYEVALVQEEDDWSCLAGRWDDLLLQTPDHTVFQSYAYQRLWWKHFGGDNDLFLVLVLRDGVVQGLAPLQLATIKMHGRYCRRLSFIGSRWEVDRPTCFFPRDPSALVGVLVAFLARRGRAWDVCDFHEQPTGSANLGTLERAFRDAGYLVARTPDSNCPFLALTGTWDGFLKGKSQTFRKNLKTAGRRLRAEGAVEYRTYERPEDTREQLEVYRGLEARSWKSAEGVGVSRSDDYFDFYREMADAFGERGGFLIRILTVEGSPVAGTFGLEFDGVFYSLQIVHDRQYSRASPGTYLEALEMEACFARGYREYEFLGGFLNNKSRWTSTVRPTSQLHVFRRTAFFTALFVVRFRLKPWLKDLIRPYMKTWHQAAPRESGGADE